jgi:hypothetical protein
MTEKKPKEATFMRTFLWALPFSIAAVVLWRIGVFESVGTAAAKASEAVGNFGEWLWGSVGGAVLVIAPIPVITFIAVFALRASAKRGV